MTATNRLSPDIPHLACRDTRDSRSQKVSLPWYNRSSAIRTRLAPKCRSGAPSGAGNEQRSRAAGGRRSGPLRAALDATRDFAQWSWPAVSRPACVSLSASQKPLECPTRRSRMNCSCGCRRPCPPGRGGGAAAVRGEGRLEAVEKTCDISVVFACRAWTDGLHLGADTCVTASDGLNSLTFIWTDEGMATGAGGAERHGAAVSGSHGGPRGPCPGHGSGRALWGLPSGGASMDPALSLRRHRGPDRSAQDPSEQPTSPRSRRRGSDLRDAAQPSTLGSHGRWRIGSDKTASTRCRPGRPSIGCWCATT